MSDVLHRLELLCRRHMRLLNPWGGRVVGWKKNSQGLRGHHNPKGWAVISGVVCKDGKPLYDTPMIVENAGSIIIALMGDKIGLIQNYRMVGPRLLSDAFSKYIEMLQQNKLWRKLAASLGRWCWEAPKGLIHEDMQGATLEEFVLRTAGKEAMQEAGLGLANARAIGTVNANPTFFAHAQYVVFAEIVSVGTASPENLEIIGRMQLFTLAELRQLNLEGQFDDGLTLAAMALCGLSLPTDLD